GVILHHDNARPHTGRMTLAKIKEHGWNLLLHPPYSPDLAPSDYYLFRSLEHFLRGKTFIDKEDIRNRLAEFFRSKDVTFFRKGIMELPERWTKVIESDGEYIID